MKKLFFLSFIACLPLTVLAQSIDWTVGLMNFFDNTEFEGSSYQHPQTMGGLRIAPTVGLKLDSIHQVCLGVNALKEFGTDSFWDGAILTAYYQYNAKPFRFMMGSFPRKGLLDALPKAFFQDSIQYYRPNMTGIWWQYQKNKLDASLFLDWTGRKALEVHEAFFVGALLTYKPSVFFAEWQGLMFHHAASGMLIGVHENFINHAAVGLDLAHLTPLDSLTADVGYLGGYSRDRRMTSAFTIRHGLLAELQAEWHRIGLASTTYIGAGMMPDYNIRGTTTYWGDPLYRGTFYNRTDLSYQFFKSKNVSLKLMSSQHFTENHCYVEQSLIGCFTIGRTLVH
ncbi:MAG: hypothetical protein Q8914_03125 [Bacteroidota bacterium]|nr:hypothetical protein [Bacteroidota bacterium]